MFRLPVASALQETLAQGYSRRQLVADLQAGVTTALVALPLGMALAIASGVPPQHGLATVVVGGAVAALAGGSRVLVTGPTAAFVALLLPITLKFGLGGLLTAGLLSGLILISMGALRLGQAVEYVPQPVITGFTSGVAVVIASLQVKDLLGLQHLGAHEHFAERLVALWQAIPTFNPWEAAVGAATLGLILVLGRIHRRLPSAIIALVLMAAATAWIQHQRPDFNIATIGSRFSHQAGDRIVPGIPHGLPGLRWPWNWNAEGGLVFHLNLNALRSLLPASLAIALLGATESLLAASVADGMTRRRHDPDAELVGQGLANLACPFFGGIPATGAIARTVASIRAGATSPFAALTHSVVVLLTVWVFAPLAAWLPMSSLAALLLVVAWNMGEVHQFRAILKVGRMGDRAVLLLCFGLTVFFDMTVGVIGGILLAALFLIRRMEELGEFRVLGPGQEGLPADAVPRDALVFQVSGALLFGAAGKVLEPLLHYSKDVSKVVLDLSPVRTMDISGLSVLESVVRELREGGKQVSLAAASPNVLALLSRSEFFSHPAHGLPVYGNLRSALSPFAEGSQTS